MIEIIYDDETNDNHCTTGNLKLPKNIRQIGEPGEKRKIYVEDYVITYINQLAKGKMCIRDRFLSAHRCGHRCF